VKNVELFDGGIIPAMPPLFFVYDRQNGSIIHCLYYFVTIVRRDNMLRLIGNMTRGTLDDMQDIMDLSIDMGGAKRNNTSYQIIYSPSGRRETDL
jgi:hypothetical protein